MSIHEQAKKVPSHVLVALRDVKGGFFHPPISERSIAVAVRSVSDAVKDQKHALSRHPADYQLYQVGSYFDDHGVIDTFTVPLLICEVASLKEVSDV